MNYKVDDAVFDKTNQQEIDKENIAEDTQPVKTIYDPCPVGYRVPTAIALKQFNGKVRHKPDVGGDPDYYIYVEVDKTKKKFLKLSSHIDPVDGSISNLNCAFLSSTPYTTYYGRTLQMNSGQGVFNFQNFDGIFTGYSIFPMKEKPKGSAR